MYLQYLVLIQNLAFILDHIIRRRMRLLMLLLNRNALRRDNKSAFFGLLGRQREVLGKQIVVF